MLNIQSLYTGETIKEMSKEISAEELISTYRNYLRKIEVRGATLEDGELGRVRYLGSKTVDIIVELIEFFGNSHPKEILLLLADLEFTLFNDLCEQYYIFRYVLEQMNTIEELIQELDNEKISRLIFKALDQNTARLYGKKVYNSYGNHGNTYYGFINELYSNRYIENGQLGLRFQLRIDVKWYNLVEMGRKLGIQEETLKRLEEIKNNTGLLTLPRHRKKGAIFSPENELECKRALMQYTDELTNILTKEFPSFIVNTRGHFSTWPDITTDFYILVAKDVPFHSNYGLVHKELVNTIQSYNQIEQEFFSFEQMHKDLILNKQERAKENPPLFAG
ncbi:hypothetical protein CN918_25620 [Priestia megaterium]|nr:hypothetical protein CN918_25620 [Priestia megaterium]